MSVSRLRRSAPLCCVLLGVTLAATDARADDSPPDGWALVRAAPLRGPVEGIETLTCDGGLEGRCERGSGRRVLAGIGRVELWQDARVTSDIRAKLWGVLGGEVAVGLDQLGDSRGHDFEHAPARNARLALRDERGAVSATLELDKPLADFELLLDRASEPPALLVREDWSAGTGDSGVIGFVVELAAPGPGPARIAFARFTGPGTAPLRYPDGHVEQEPVGADDRIVIPSRGTLEISREGESPSLADTYCMHHTAHDAAGGHETYAPTTVHLRYARRDGGWERDVAVGFEGCDF